MRVSVREKVSETAGVSGVARLEAGGGAAVRRGLAAVRGRGRGGLCVGGRRLTWAARRRRTVRGGLAARRVPQLRRAGEM